MSPSIWRRTWRRAGTLGRRMHSHESGQPVGERTARHTGQRLRGTRATRRRVHRPMARARRPDEHSAGLRGYAAAPRPLVADRFQLVNVAHWDSAEAVQAAQADPEFQQRVNAAIADPQVRFAAHPALYRVVAEVLRPDAR